MLKKVKLLFLTVFVVSLFTLLGATAFAVNTATITLTVNDDANTAGKVSGLTTTLYDAAGNDITTAPGIAITESSGVYTIANITTKGAYDVKVTSSGGASITVPVTVTGTSATGTVKAAKVTWVEAGSLNVKKSGAIGGLALNAAGTAALADVTVKAYNTSGTWTTSTSAIGFYKLYVPVGTYTLVVYGKDANGTDYKNVYSTVKVAAGQMSGPIEDLSAQTSWTNNAATAGYTLTSAPKSDSKIIAGTASKNSTVSVYLVDSDGKYSLVTSKKTTATGAFSISLTSYIPGGSKVSIKVTDVAFNVFEDTTLVDAPLANRTMTLTAGTASASANTVNTPVVVAYADSTATMTTNLTANITSVSAVGVTTPGAIALVKGTNYKVSGGKITINAGVLNLAQNYTISVVATGYTSASAIQIVGPSVKAATAPTGTFTAAPGSVAGATKFTAVGTAGTDNTLKYIVTSTNALQKAGNPLVSTTTIAAVTVNTDITGVDATTNKYIQVYEVKTEDNTIVKAKLVTLSASNIKAPSVLYTYVSGTTVAVVTDVTLKTTAPASTTFVVKAGATTATTTKAVSSVAISGKGVAVTLGATVTSPQAVTIAYSKPGTTANPVSDSSGNAMASFAAKNAINLTANDGANTTAAAVTLNATSVAIGSTLSAASNEVGILYLVPTATTATLTGLNNAVFAGTGTAVVVATANAATLLPTTGLEAGTYKVYAVNYSGNLSPASADVTVTK